MQGQHEPQACQPPMGVQSEWAWNNQRMWALLDAIARYRSADLAVPAEWLGELRRILDLPTTPPLVGCNRTLHHNGGIHWCRGKLGHEPDGHLFEVADVDTRVEADFW